MKVEGRIFLGVAVFLFAADIVYWYLSKDPTGTTALGLSGGLSILIAYYLLYTSRRMEPRPEDRADATIEEGAGELGFFSPGSVWPIVVAFAATVASMGIIFGLWLFFVGAFVLVIGLSGLMFEYYVHRPASD
ncbi:MAG: cytochrome c oxidase subunit 4 [Actinomycetota bacterium]|nr:cytochrome c oxidase subunit 4 [Actinomycetota bacterium]